MAKRNHQQQFFVKKGFYFEMFSDDGQGKNGEVVSKKKTFVLS